MKNIAELLTVPAIVSVLAMNGPTAHSQAASKRSSACSHPGYICTRGSGRAGPPGKESNGLAEQDASDNQSAHTS
jgi:hypothetical protein